MLGQALVPDMLRRGYHPTMTVGPIIAIGGVDMLIPPSNLAVIFATIASSLSIVKVSVAELLIAGTLPGLIMSAALYRLHRGALLVESETGAARGHRRMPRRAAAGCRSCIHILPLLFIFTIMMGSMYIGWASPSESAAAGCLATVVLALVYRAMTWSILLDALRATVDRHDDAVFDHLGFDDFRSEFWRSPARSMARSMQLAAFHADAD